MFGDYKTSRDRLSKRDWVEYLSGWALGILVAIFFAYCIWHAGMVDIVYGIV